VFHLTELKASNTVKAFLVHAVGNCTSGQKSASRKLEGSNHGKQLLSQGGNNTRYFIGQNCGLYCDMCAKLSLSVC
jgi:hypothetical protein